MLTRIRANLVLFFALLAVSSVLYPAGLWLFAQGLFPTKANGSLVVKDGAPVGSSQIAQAFTKDEYFWPRPSAAGYNGGAAGGSNWGSNNPKLRDRAAQLLGPNVKYTKAGPRKGAAVGPDVETWFAAEPDRAAKWATDYPTSATNWAKADLTNDVYGPNGDYVTTWAKDHPDVVAAWKAANPKKTDEPKPEDMVGEFFASYAKANPGTFPTVTEAKAADGTVTKRVGPAKDGSTIQALFFDMWLQDPANKERAADVEPAPADFVTASGAGLDPHITARNARWQLDRVAAKRAPTDTERARQGIDALIGELSSSPLAGLAGEPLVNVLALNLELDKRFPVAASAP